MQKYETRFKLKVVESFLAGEGGAKLLARRWSVPEEKVRTWVSHYRLHGVAGLQPKRGAYTAHFKLQVLSHPAPDAPPGCPGVSEFLCSRRIVEFVFA
jgi:transposase